MQTVSAYGTAPMLAWMVEEKDIEPHVPMWDKTERKNDSFSSNDFHWNEEAEEYRCPAGNPLRSEWRAFKNERSHVTKANTIIFRSRQADCATCLMKAKCCPNTISGGIVAYGSVIQGLLSHWADSIRWTQAGTGPVSDHCSG